MDETLSHGDSLLAQFLEVNMRAVIKLYTDPRRRHLLEGAETLEEGLVLLLRHQLTYRTSVNDDDKTQAAIRRREKSRAAGRQSNKLEDIPYLGVVRASRVPGSGYKAVAYVAKRDGTKAKHYVTIGHFPTTREAALAYDDFMIGRGDPRAKTNANTGRL